jgi:predicted metal-dependent peptidase
MSATDMIRKARANALLDRPFYGAVSMAWELVEDPTCKTLWTDGKRLGFNPQYVEGLKAHYGKSAIAHEAKHVTDMHHLRRGDREHDTWNEACDIVVNDQLDSEGFDIDPDWLRGAKYGLDGTKISAEQAYSFLMNRKAQDKAKKDQQKQQGKDGKGAGGDKGQASPAPGQGDGKPGEGDAPSGPGEVRDYPSAGEKLTEAEITQAKNETRTKIVQAATQAKAWGKLPADLERMIKEIVDPRMPWQELLRRFVQRSAKNDYRFFPPNRRHVAAGLYLPSVRSDELGSVVIAVDTSGSIGQEELNKFSAEISGILEAYDAEITVVYFDAQVCGTQNFNRQDLPLKLEPQGGGGTDFIPALEWVDAEMESPPDCMIYLTDLCCGSYPNEPGFPVLWVSTTDRQAPFGETVHMD